MEEKRSIKFQSSLREVMLYIKHSKDKEALNKVVNGNRERFQRVERRALLSDEDIGRESSGRGRL